MEAGDWAKATERARRHPREVKAWATLRTKTCSASKKATGAKRLALHHACFKLRNSLSGGSSTGSTVSPTEDPFIEVCRFILVLLEIYPEAAGIRESRHGCLPIHLAAFASCTKPSPSDESLEDYVDTGLSPAELTLSASLSSMPMGSNLAMAPSTLTRPRSITQRSQSESTADTMHTNISNVLAEEYYTGSQTFHQASNRIHHRRSSSSDLVGSHLQPAPRGASIAMNSNILISEQREEMAVKVLNALLDAYPKGIRMDSEGGRLPLHTACAGRATPRVIATLVTAYPAAARHRNKDGYLPLHVCAHWGISHPNCAINLLKAYPDATFGRNRWERTPLEEALCMAGENGRPHQEALVRALRKHPSYWTRPSELLASPRENHIVDIDETLPSNEDESTEDEPRIFDSGNLEG